MKYHISPTSGRPNQCRATKRGCPLGAGPEEHYASKDEAREAYEAQNKDSVVAEPLKKKAVLVLTHANGRPIRPVATQAELDSELSELEREDLYGSDLASTLRVRGVNLKEIEESENEGSYAIEFKVPSYYETSCSTDLARRELGYPQREKSDADRIPLRIAQLELIKVESDYYGRLLSETEGKELREKMEALKLKVEVERNRPRIEAARSKVDLSSLSKNNYRANVRSLKGTPLGVITKPLSAGEKFEVFDSRDYGSRYSRAFGKFNTEEEALTAILAKNLYRLEQE